MSKAQQSSAGSRMAQETSIFWLKIALLVAKSCPPDAISKLIQIIARLTNAGFRDFRNTAIVGSIFPTPGFMEIRQLRR